jgi:hypothetical protein
MNRPRDDRKAASNIQVVKACRSLATVLAGRASIRYHAKEAGEEQVMSTLFMRA